MKKALLISIIIIIILVSLAFLIYNYADDILGKAELCRLQGGVLIDYVPTQFLDSKTEICVFNKAPDAGKTCVNSDECYYNCVVSGDNVDPYNGYCQSYEYYKSGFKRWPLMPDQVIIEELRAVFKKHSIK